MIEAPPPKRNPMSAGIALAVLPLTCCVIGGLRGQPTIGLLVGIALGAAVAAAVWLIDRAR